MTLKGILDKSLLTAGAVAFFTVQSALYGCGAPAKEVKKPATGQQKPAKTELVYFYNPDCAGCADLSAAVDAAEARFPDVVDVSRRCVPMEGSGQCVYVPNDYATACYLRNQVEHTELFGSNEIPDAIIIKPGGQAFRAYGKEGICEALGKELSCLD